MPKARSLSGLKVYYGDITGLQLPFTLILYVNQQTLKPPAVIGVTVVMAGLWTNQDMDTGLWGSNGGVWWVLWVAWWGLHGFDFFSDAQHGCSIGMTSSEV